MKGPKKVNKTILLCCASICLFGNSIIAQNTTFLKKASKEKNAYFSINNSFPTIGQSFIANQTGFITSITLMVNEESTSNSTIDLWIGANPKHGELLKGKPRQKVKLTNNNEYMLFIPLNKPFPVQKGKKYRLQFGHQEADSNWNVVFSGSFKNSFPLGEIYFDDGTSRFNRDLIFSVSISSKKRVVALND